MRGSTSFWRTSGILVYGAISPGLFRASCLNIISRLKWVPPCLSCMSRRCWSRKVASCLRPCLASRSTTSIKLFCRVRTAPCLWTTLSVNGKTLNRVERAMQLCVNSIQDWVSKNGFKFSTSKTVRIHFHQQYCFPQTLISFWEKRLKMYQKKQHSLVSFLTPNSLLKITFSTVHRHVRNPWIFFE